MTVRHDVKTVSVATFSLSVTGVLILLEALVEAAARHAPLVLLTSMFVVCWRSQTWKRPLLVLRPVIGDDVSSDVVR